MPINEGKQLRSGQAAHPGERQLSRFMCGELPRAEARAIVRHLLTECQRCIAVTRGFWERGERSSGLEAELEELVAEELKQGHRVDC